MRLRARRLVRAWLGALDRIWSLETGDEMLTEISVKFREDDPSNMLLRHGFAPVRGWTDLARDYSLTLARAV